MFERQLRQFSVVRRWATVRCLFPQNLAEHSFYVAMYADQIATAIDWQGDRAALLQHALWHDAGELASGDVAGPWKRHAMSGSSRDHWHRMEAQAVVGWFGDCYINCDDPEIRAIVRVADILDQVFFALTEMSLGNDDFNVVYDNSTSNLGPAIAALPCYNSVQISLHSIIMVDAVRQHRHNAAGQVIGEEG